MFWIGRISKLPINHHFSTLGAHQYLSLWQLHWSQTVLLGGHGGRQVLMNFRRWIPAKFRVLEATMRAFLYSPSISIAVFMCSVLFWYPHMGETDSRTARQPTTEKKGMAVPIDGPFGWASAENVWQHLYGAKRISKVGLCYIDTQLLKTTLYYTQFCQQNFANSMDAFTDITEVDMKRSCFTR